MMRKPDRKKKDQVLFTAMAASLAALLGVLACVPIYIVIQSLGTMSFKFLFTSTADGGMITASAATLSVVGISLLCSLPVGLITAVYLAEHPKGCLGARLIRFSLETLEGMPSVIYGLFGLLVFYRGLGLGRSIIAGGLTAGIMLIPHVARTCEHSLSSIPQSFREGSLALGAANWQTLCRLVLPAAVPGIVAALLLAAARVAGTAALILLTVGINTPQRQRTLTAHLYYKAVETDLSGDVQLLYAAAAVLAAGVFLLHAAGRAAAIGWKKRMDHE